MIVDDDADMAALVITTIELSDNEVTVTGVASSGAEALAKLGAARPDVIVLDYRMPERNGLEVAADILELEPHQNIVLFTAFLDGETERQALRVGVRECVAKDHVMQLPDILRKYTPRRRTQPLRAS